MGRALQLTTIERRIRLQIVRYGIDVRELCALIRGAEAVVPDSYKARIEFAHLLEIGAIQSEDSASH